MSYQEVKLTAIDIKQYQGKEFEAYYKGFRTIETDFGESKVHEFVSKKNNQGFAVYGFTMFDKKLEVVPVNCAVKFQYTGTENVKTKYGKKDVHQVSVLFNSADTLAKTEAKEAVGAAMEEVEQGAAAPQQKNSQKPVDDGDDLPF